MRKLIFPVIFILISAALNGQLVFRDADLAADGRLLFTAELSGSSIESYKTLFTADLNTGRVSPLTFYPEDAKLVDKASYLQIYNRFGVFTSREGTEIPVESRNFPSFAAGEFVKPGRLSVTSLSPDGKYYLKLVQKSPAYADLFLYDADGTRSRPAAERLEYTTMGPRLKWSPESDFFIYEKKGELFYFSIDQLKNNRVLAEKFRKIGDGGIASVQWAKDNSFFYINGQYVYRVLTAELFGRSLYSDLISIGTTAGKIHFDFNPDFDTYWISPDGTALVLNKENRNVFYVDLKNGKDRPSGANFAYIRLGAGSRALDLIWPETAPPVFLTENILSGRKELKAWRLENDAAGNFFFKELPLDSALKVRISPDAERAVFIYPDRLVFKSYKLWTELFTVKFDNPLDILWKNEKTVVITGRNLVRELDLETKQSRLLCFSQADAYGFSEESGRIQIKNSGRVFELDEEGAWKEVPEFTVLDRNLISPAWRVYLEDAAASFYKNRIMIRNLKGVGTKTLFKVPEKQYEAFPAKDEPVDFRHFTHGSRLRQRSIALIFDAVDNDEGLAEILSVLDTYSIKATFFINGEFIRRNPESVKEIVMAGHEAASMFNVNFDMTDSRYRVGTDFIRKGLARNEDEFFAAAGRELSLIWHAPYYKVTDEIIAAAAEMNYIYAGRDIDTLDWVEYSVMNEMSGRYLSAPELTERIINLKKPGSIIPLRLGKAAGGRKDYLFRSLDVLINSLLERGYTMVKVSEMIESAR